VDEPVDDNPPPGETVAQKQHRIFGHGRDTGRIEYFTDAVIAIAMTLLVLDIKLPKLGHDESIFHALGRSWEQFFAYALSFLIIALNWVFHHRRFRAIVRYDTILIWINLAFLLFIAIVPFPTSLLAEVGTSADTIALYVGTLAVIGLLGAACWWYAHRAGLMSTTIDRSLYVYILGSNLISPVVFVLAIPFAYALQALRIDTSWALWFLLLNWVGARVWDRLRGRRVVERRAGDELEG
jgi:uncharacterized membrane protein